MLNGMQLNAYTIRYVVGFIYRDHTVCSKSSQQSDEHKTVRAIFCPIELPLVLPAQQSRMLHQKKKKNKNLPRRCTDWESFFPTRFAPEC